MIETRRVQELAAVSVKGAGPFETSASYRHPSRRCLAKVGIIFLVAGVIVAASAVLAGRFTWNMTPSVPRGLYAVRRDAPPRRGDIVRFSVPASVSELMSSRRYLPGGGRLLKRIVAVTGDHVCLDGHAYAINGRAIASVRPNDSIGRPLPLYRFCGTAFPGEAYVATPASFSFDSRYFGPLPLSALTVVNAVWTY